MTKNKKLSKLSSLLFSQLPHPQHTHKHAVMLVRQPMINPSSVFFHSKKNYPIHPRYSDYSSAILTITTNACFSTINSLLKVNYFFPSYSFNLLFVILSRKQIIYSYPHQRELKYKFS